MKISFLAPLVIVMGFYSQWIPSMVEGSFSPRQESFLRALDIAILIFAMTFLAGSIKTAAKMALWLAVLFIAAYLLATYSGSAGKASDMVRWIQATFHLDWDTALRYTIYLRKTIHVTFYALVAWSAFWAGWNGSLRGISAVIYGAGIALILACFDESRQLTSAGRGGSGWDVLLDMSGASVALIAAIVFSSLKERKRPKRRSSPALGTSP